MRSLFALLLTLPLLLTGCGDGAGSDASDDSGSGPLSAVSVSGDQQSKPKVTVERKNFSVKETTVNVLEEGDGGKVAPNDLITVDYLGVNGKSGKEFDSSWKRNQPASFALGPGMIKGFNTALAGQQVGSRVLAAIPPKDGYGPRGNPQAGIGGKDTLVFVIDIRGTAPSHATGTAVEAPAGAPELKIDDNDVPTGFAEDADTAAAPKRATAHTLIEGDGAKVEAGHTVTMQYLGQVFPDGKVFDSSWGRAPLTVPVGQGQPIPCFDELVGSTIGSRVVLTCPPSTAFGDKGNPQVGIKGGDSVLFAVDVLAAR